MPPKKREEDTPAGLGGASSSTAFTTGTGMAMPGDGRPHMFKYSSMTGVAGALQMKNMSSGFMKEDRNSYWNRRAPNTGAVMQDRKAKRRRLFKDGTEEEEDAQTNGDASMAVDTEKPNGGNDNDVGKASDDDNSDNDSDDSSASTSKKLKGKARELNPNAPALPSPSKVLIVHPGAPTLRIGLTHDSVPLEMPYCIARRAPTTPGANTLNTNTPFATSSEAFDETKLENLRYDLKARMRILNLRGTTGGSIAAAEYNATVQSAPVDDESDDDKIAWTDPSQSPTTDVYFGQEALRIPSPASHGFAMRWPFRKGTFNTHGYSSMNELLGDVEAIWMHALEKLGVKTSELDQYSVILLIPDRYTEVYVRQMCDLVLKTMSFAQLIVHQEGLSASFSAGLPSACVIDIGSSQTSVSCVDEGMVINDSRMVQSYGGDDMIELFLRIAKTVGFPYKDADLSRAYDWELCRWLVEQCCCFNEHNFGVNAIDFTARRPGQPSLRFSMKLHDEVALPTYGLWVPRVLDWEAKLQPLPELIPESKDVEDLIDIGGDAITGAMKQSVAHLEQPRPHQLPAAALGANGTSDQILTVPDSGLAGSVSAPGTPNPDGKPANVDSTSAQTDATKALDPKGEEVEVMEQTVDYVGESSKLPLDVAVMESLSQCGSDDKLKRVITNILVVGGIGNMQGVGFALQSRLERLVRERFPGMPAPLVIPKAKYADSAHLAWKGVSNLCKLDISHDMWIRRDDWDMLNIRALRDRSYFAVP